MDNSKLLEKLKEVSKGTAVSYISGVIDEAIKEIERLNEVEVDMIEYEAHIYI